jgi:hypothetical protein
MDNMDIARVANIMSHLNWKWSSTDGVPTEYDIRQHVRKQFKAVIERSSTSALPRHEEGTGGFYYDVFREDGEVVHVRMRFELCSSQADVDWLGE